MPSDTVLSETQVLRLATAWACINARDVEELVIAALAARSGVDVEVLAKQFHDTYERLAPEFGYQTRNDTKLFEPWSSNGKLMTAVVREVVGLALATAEALHEQRETLWRRLVESTIEDLEASYALGGPEQSDETTELRKLLGLNKGE